MMHKKRKKVLDEEAMADLTELWEELIKCESQTEFNEIVETMREILFLEIEKGDIHFRTPHSTKKPFK